MSHTLTSHLYLPGNALSEVPHRKVLVQPPTPTQGTRFSGYVYWRQPRSQKRPWRHGECVRTNISSTRDPGAKGGRVEGRNNLGGKRGVKKQSKVTVTVDPLYHIGQQKTETIGGRGVCVCVFLKWICNECPYVVSSLTVYGLGEPNYSVNKDWLRSGNK